MPNVQAPNVHLLRISKTGSTTLKTFVETNGIQQAMPGGKLVLHSHKATLPEVLQNPRNRAAFFLREPLSRFVSGFNSRVLEVPQARDIPRVAKETVALKHFSTANQLAEALTSEREQEQDRAYAAMRVLMHARLTFTDWLIDLDYLQRRLHRIAFIGFVETYDEDVRRFVKVLGVERELEIPHERRADETVSRELSDVAAANLRAWYADDIAIYEWALTTRDRWTQTAAPQAAAASPDGDAE